MNSVCEPMTPAEIRKKLQTNSKGAVMQTIAFLADLMGHESIETTRIYLRKTATEQREIVDTIIDW